MTAIAIVGVVVPIALGLFAYFAQAWIVLGIAVAIFVIDAVWASRRVHHFDCVACGHDARDHLLGRTTKVKYCTPRCGCQITDDSPLRRVSLLAYAIYLVDRWLEPLSRGPVGVTP